MESFEGSNGGGSSSTQITFNDNLKWHKVSVIKSGYETILVVDRTRSSTHRSDITIKGSESDEENKNENTWGKRRRLNVPENIGSKVLSTIITLQMQFRINKVALICDNKH